MDTDINPEPTDAERAAILAALEQEASENADFVKEIEVDDQ